MNWRFQTLVRLFLLFGGLAFLVFGALEGSTFEVALGGGAALLGAFGLWRERSVHGGE